METRYENLLHIPMVILAQSIVDVSLYGCCDSAPHEREQHDNTTDNVIDTKVVNPEGIQHDTACIEGDAHDQKHPEIQKNRISGNPFVICC